MGRKKKKIDDIRVVLEDILAEKIMPNGEKGRAVSTLEALVNAELTSALSGNLTAIKSLITRAKKYRLFTRAEFKKSMMVLTEPNGDEGKIVRMYHAEQSELRRAAENDGRIRKTEKRH